MGFFDKLKQKSDNFFDGLQQNAIDKALAAARENNQKDDSVNKIKNLQKLSFIQVQMLPKIHGNVTRFHSAQMAILPLWV